MNNYPIPHHPTWDVIDPSKTNDFMECPRKYFFSRMLGWTPESPSNHLVFGAAWHKAQEHLLLHGYEAKSINDAQELLREHYRKEFPEETDEIFSPKTPDRAVLALVEYAVKWAKDLRDFEVLYTEISGAVPVSDRTVMHFRMDSILQHRRDGYYLSYEHKTGTYLNNQWLMQWPLSIQIGCYIHALNCMYFGEDIRGVNVRGTFFKKTKAPLFDFDEVPCRKSPGQMRAWHSDITYYLNEIRRETDLMMSESDSDSVMNSFPHRPTSCNNYFGCQFHDFCMAWPNPLRRCDEPPLGFKIEYWDPRQEDARYEMEFKPLDMLEGMISELEHQDRGE